MSPDDKDKNLAESDKIVREAKRERRKRRINFIGALLFSIPVLFLPLLWPAYDYAYTCRIPQGTKVVDFSVAVPYAPCFEYFFQSEKYRLWPLLYYRRYVIPDGATEIVALCFCQRHLRSIRIADSVTSIGERAFADCPFLRDVALPESLTEIRSGMFVRCSNLKHIRIPSGVRSIERYAFCQSGLLEIVLPESLESIGEGAFTECTGLKKIVIPPKVKEIGPRAFADCTALADVELPPGMTVAPDAFEGTPFQQAAERKGTSPELTSVTIRRP
jgi:hypothetical protein